jgi:hypothetical protein
MRRTPLVLFAVLAAAGLITSCGDDDDGGEEASAFCEGFLELNQTEPTPERIREVAADAPEDAVDAMNEIADGIEEEGEAYFEGDSAGDNFVTVSQAAVDECAEEEIDVTASEYKFEGIPEEMDAGIVGVNFENTGGELHELVVFAKGPDAGDATFDELLELGEDEAEGKLLEKGGSFAEPGQTSPGIFELEAGDYVAVCFIPEGTSGDEEGQGPPHFTKGMKTEFTVS